MPVEWPPERDSVNVMETLDRLFDKGVVIDPWARATTDAIDLVHEDRRIVVASVETYPEATGPERGR